MTGKVLASGGSGQIAGFLVRRLVAQGWEVHTTIRKLAKEDVFASCWPSTIRGSGSLPQTRPTTPVEPRLWRDWASRRLPCCSFNVPLAKSMSTEEPRG